jgi:protein-S-isoprenylcysteine O-methyltransferase Ste14
MNLESLFSALGYLWLIAEILLALFTSTRKGGGKVVDRGSQLILWVVIIAVSWIDGWMHTILPVDMPGSHTWLRPLAFGILLLGLAIRITAIVTLGRAFSANVAMRNDQQLRRNGLYGIVRHPSYLGLELILLAFALHSRTWACVAVVFITPTLAVLYRIHVEEKVLREAFGTEYEDYGRTTKRLFPGIY